MYDAKHKRTKSSSNVKMKKINVKRVVVSTAVVGLLIAPQILGTISASADTFDAPTQVIDPVTGEDITPDPITTPTVGSASDTTNTTTNKTYNVTADWDFAGGYMTKDVPVAGGGTIQLQLPAPGSPTVNVYYDYDGNGGITSDAQITRTNGVQTFTIDFGIGVIINLTVNVTGVADAETPTALTAPTGVSISADGSTVTANAMAGSQFPLVIEDADGNRLGGGINANGSMIAPLSRTLVSGETIKVYVKDVNEGTVSDAVYVTFEAPKETGSVAVQGILQGTGEVLYTDSVDGNVDESVTATAQTLDGYTLLSEPTMQAVVGQDATVTFEYSKDEVKVPEVKTGTLTINYVDQDGNVLSPSTTKEVTVGDTYTEQAPYKEGYSNGGRDGLKTETGTMDADGETITFTYTDVRMYSATINFIDEDGKIISTHEDKSQKGVTVNFEYMGFVPDGYIPDVEEFVQDGTITTVNVNVKKVDKNVTATLHVYYVDTEGNTMAPTVTKQVAVGDKFVAEAVFIGGYTFDNLAIHNGVMDADGEDYTYTYTKDSSTSTSTTDSSTSTSTSESKDTTGSSTSTSTSESKDTTDTTDSSTSTSTSESKDTTDSSTSTNTSESKDTTDSSTSTSTSESKDTTDSSTSTSTSESKDTTTGSSTSTSTSESKDTTDSSTSTSTSESKDTTGSSTSTSTSESKDTTGSSTSTSTSESKDTTGSSTSTSTSESKDTTKPSTDTKKDSTTDSNLVDDAVKEFKDTIAKLETKINEASAKATTTDSTSATTDSKANTSTTSTKSDSSTTKDSATSASNKEYPKTGEEQATTASLAGIVLAGIAGIIALVFKKGYSRKH